MKLRLGLVGLSHPHSPGHLAALELMDDVETIYVCDDDAAALAKIKDRPKIGGVYTDLDDLLRRDDVPVLLLVMPNDRLAPLTVRAVSAGKHVMSDKPGARTAAEMAQVLDAAAANDVLVSAFYCYRWSPNYRKVEELRRQGAFGRVLSAEMRMVTTSVAKRNPSSWIFRQAAAGGGILHWLGCHEIDRLRYITGEEIVAVSAMTDTLSGERIDVEDIATVSFRLSGGAVATLHIAYAIGTGQPGYTAGIYDTYFALHGAQGRAWTERDSDVQSVVVESYAPGLDHANQQTFTYAMPTSAAYAGVFGMDFLRAFCHAALEGGTPPVTGEDALRVLQVIEAAYRSAQSGRTVHL